MHAEQETADADRGDQRNDDHREHPAPDSARRGQEDQEQRAVADDRTERVPTGEAVTGAVGDGMGDHGAQPADQGLEDRVQRQFPGPGDQEIDREPPLPPDGQQDHGRSDQGPQHPAAAQPGDRLDHADNRGVPGDQAVQPGRGAVISRFQRRPLQSHQQEEQRKDDRRGGDNTKRSQISPGSG